MRMVAAASAATASKTLSLMLATFAAPQYGVGVEPTDDYGRRCLLARRLVEQGVRLTIVVSGGGPGNLQWDAHSDIVENHLRMAGGGIKGGQLIGATDAIGMHAISDRCHFRDIHTTILHQLRLKQEELVFLHEGREERLTLVEGHVIDQIV